MKINILELFLSLVIHKDMRKIINLILAILIFMSCSNDIEISCNKNEQHEYISETFKYTEVVNLFSQDSTTSAQILLNSNSKALFDYTKESLKIVTDICELGREKISQKENSENYYKEEEVMNEIFIDILSIETDKEIVGFKTNFPRTDLKTTQLPWMNTFIYSIFINLRNSMKYNYQYVAFFIMIKAKMGFLLKWDF